MYDFANATENEKIKKKVPCCIIFKHDHYKIITFFVKDVLMSKGALLINLCVV